MKMKATGIVRRIDDGRRIPIPAAICKALGVREGDALEYFTDGRAIQLQKYEPLTDGKEKQNNGMA